ncbi:MAG: hypothetical protein IKD04_09000 [Clostridia bacterium]|nr:hypothetical protein [Clostridia bacterium]
MRVSKLFSDHAVFQRNKPIKLWGEGEGVVSATLNGQTAYTVCRGGFWKLSLPPMQAGGPYDLILKDSKEQIVLSQICIGEVWLAAGQSNMEHITMLTYDGFEDAESLGNNSNIRFFTVPRKTRETDSQKNWHFEAVEPAETEWQVCTPEAALHFSAIGFRFASLLQRDKDIPVGIISVNWGGTPAEAWIEESAFFAEPELCELRDNYYNILEKLDLDEYTKGVDAYQQLMSKRIENVSARSFAEEKGIEWLARTSPFEWPTEPPLGPYSCRWVGVLFERMIKPLLPYSVSGVLWYQGESNVHNKQYYLKLFSKLVECWRKGFEDDLPFFTVQIAPFGYAYKEGCTQLVAQQIEATGKIENVFLVTTNDIGEKDNIHPLNKKSISERLFLAAKKEVFGEDVEYCGPIFKKAVLEKAGTVRVSFTHAGSGLRSNGEVLNLYLKGEGGEYKPAKARIEGNELVAWSPEVESPTEIKMAFDNTDVINLYNNDGIVAAPFYSEIGR